MPGISRQGAGSCGNYIHVTIGFPRLYGRQRLFGKPAAHMFGPKGIRARRTCSASLPVICNEEDERRRV